MNLHQSATPVAFLYVGDRERALLFYRDKLGLPLRSSDDFGDFIDLGGALARMTVMPDHQPRPHPVLGWNVEDIAAAAADLADRDIGLIRYEHMDQDELGIWTAPDGATRVAFFADPDGNVLSIAQV
jgi:catechol 2,3-dioxygenase-like lactoylglutathione lyase family enzyme